MSRALRGNRAYTTKESVMNVTKKVFAVLFDVYMMTGVIIGMLVGRFVFGSAEEYVAGE